MLGCGAYDEFEVLLGLYGQLLPQAECDHQFISSDSPVAHMVNKCLGKP